MSKIYSRPRLKLPKIVFCRNSNRQTSKKRATIVMIFFIAFATLKIILDAVTPIFDTLCENKAISMATNISNKKATEVMKEHTYNELYSIEKDEQGNIKMLNANVVPINQITSEIAVKIQNEINKEGRDDVEIALRKFYRNEITCRSWTRYKNKNFIYGKC